MPQSMMRAACQKVKPNRLVSGIRRAVHSWSVTFASRSRNTLNEPASCISRTFFPVIQRQSLMLLAWSEEVERLRTRDLVSGTAAGVVGGYVGTKVMNPVTTKLYELAPEADKARERAVSPGSPYRIGVQKAAALLGTSLTEEQLNAAAAAAPYMVGISGGLLYVALRRVLHLNPIVA